MSDPRRLGRWARLAPLGVITLLFAALALSGAFRRLSLATLQADHTALADYAGRHPVLSLCGFLGTYSLVAAVGAPGLFVMTLAGGFLFGPIVGGALTLAALTTGGLALFLACRTAFGDWAARRAGPTLARLEAGFSRDAFAYLLALRLAPIAPFFAVTLAAGLTRTGPATFVAATLIGAAPSSFIIAGLGSGLGRLFARHARLGPGLMARPEVAIPLAALALLSLAPPGLRLWAARRARRRPA